MKFRTNEISSKGYLFYGYFMAILLVFSPLDQVHSQQRQTTEISEIQVVEIDEDAVKRRASKHSYSEIENVTKEKKRSQKEKQNSKPERKAKHGFWEGSMGKTISYTLAVLALLTLIYFLVSRLKYSTEKRRSDHKMDLMNDIIDSESLENVDIEVELQHALELKEYRQAIRWLYLQNLKLMIQKGLLRPSPEKTNQDYLSEIQSLEFQEGFLHLTRIFERIWYGHRLPDRSAFLDWKAQFDHYYQLIRLNS